MRGLLLKMEVINIYFLILNKNTVDPQEDALVKGKIDDSRELESTYDTLKSIRNTEEKIVTVNGNWIQFYKNISNHIKNQVRK